GALLRAPAGHSPRPPRHDRPAPPVFHGTRRGLAARPRRPARGKTGARRRERADPHRGNRYHVRHRLEGPVSHRGSRLRLFGQRQRPGDYDLRLPDRSARGDRLIWKFQISLVSVSGSSDTLVKVVMRNLGARKSLRWRVIGLARKDTVLETQVVRLGHRGTPSVR